MKMQWVVSSIALAMCACGVELQAGEAIKGRVIEVDADTVRVTTDSQETPEVGDAVEIIMEFPGLEGGAVAAEGKVTSAGANKIGVRVLRKFGEVEKGMLARIISEKPREAMGQAPQQGRVVLFGGGNADDWQQADGSPCNWPIVDGVMEVGVGDAQTKETFRDFRLHLEFQIPSPLPDKPRAENGNSGVYLQSRYEVQVIDSFGTSMDPIRACGSIWGHSAPRRNVAKPPGEWQSYDITFHAARFDSSGNKSANARVTLIWNGVTVQDDVGLIRSSPRGLHESSESGPIRLQDWGYKVRYRNIWIAPTGDT